MMKRRGRKMEYGGFISVKMWVEEEEEEERTKIASQNW